MWRCGVWGFAGCCGSHEQDAPERIDDTGWCRCLDADLDELETSLRDIEAVAAGRASAVKGLGEAIRGFVYCLSVEMRDWFSHRQGEMAAEVAVWEGSGLSEGNGGCVGVWQGMQVRRTCILLYPRASPSSTPCQPNSSHPIPPLHAPSQPSPREPGSLPFPGLRSSQSRRYAARSSWRQEGAVVCGGFWCLDMERAHASVAWVRGWGRAVGQLNVGGRCASGKTKRVVALARVVRAGGVFRALWVWPSDSPSDWPFWSSPSALEFTGGSGYSWVGHLPLLGCTCV